MSNIAEGFERGSNQEFIQFLYIAKGSAGKVRTRLYIAFDHGYIGEKDFGTGRSLCQEVYGQISGLIQYLKNSRYRGEKFSKEYRGFREEVQDFLKDFSKRL